MTTQQPEALRLAEILEGGYSLAWLYEHGGYEVSAELRRQHARITALEAQLEAVGAGGVGPLIASAGFDAADSVPAVEREQERIAFKDAHRHLELDEVPDAWGRPMFKHPHVEASWLGWIARASHGLAPAETGNSVSAQADSVQEDADRYRWLREGNDVQHGAAWHVAVNLYGFEWDAAIDAAMNKGATQ